MKKFVFSLQTLYDLKIKEEKNQKRELGQIEAKLDILKSELGALKAEYDAYANEYREYLKGSISMDEMNQYNYYFADQSDLIDQKKDEIIDQNEVKKICVGKLVEILKDIKSYEKLKEKQYEEYQVESKKEENQTMDDILSYNTIAI